MPPTPTKLMAMFVANTVMFAFAALVFWGIEAAWGRFFGKPQTPFPRNGRMGLKESLVFVLRKMPWVLCVALALSAGATYLAKWLGLDLPSQDLLKWLAGDTYSVWVKVAIIAFVLTEAPILEELVFRRFVFRAIYRRCKLLWPAVILSASLFALMHWNALAFVPLAFLGGAFAWIYWRTGRLMASVFAHFLFNALNVVLLFTFPEMA